MKRPALLSCAFALAACSSAPPPAPETKVSQPAPAKILQFYASPVTIAKGDRTLLCYGVEGAESVRLDPAVEEIAPSRTRCIEAKPAASTKYTSYAKNRNGDEVSQQVEVVIDLLCGRPHNKSSVARSIMWRRNRLPSISGWHTATSAT